MVLVAFWASRKERLGDEDEDGSGGQSNGGTDGEENDESAGKTNETESTEAHKQHIRQGILRVQREAVTVLALPYLAILAIVAALTLPAPWRGLLPIDGWIMLRAC